MRPGDRDTWNTGDVWGTRDGNTSSQPDTRDNGDIREALGMVILVDQPPLSFSAAELIAEGSRARLRRRQLVLAAGSAVAACAVAVFALVLAQPPPPRSVEPGAPPAVSESELSTTSPTSRNPLKSTTPSSRHPSSISTTTGIPHSRTSAPVDTADPPWNSTAPITFSPPLSFGGRPPAGFTTWSSHLPSTTR